MQLSIENINFFKSNGYLFFDKLFSNKEISNLRIAVEEVCDSNGENITPELNGTGVRMIHGTHTYNNSFSNLCRHPRIVEPAEQLLNSQIYIHQSRLNLNKGLGTGGFDWHQDYATWKDIDGLKEPRALMIAVFIDNVTAANGPLLFIPKSHTEGVINEFEPVEDKTGNILMSLNRKKLKNLVDSNGIKAGLGDLGSVLFMHCNLVHGSSENISPYSRTLFYVNVSSVENPQTTFSRKDFHAGRDFTPIVTVDDNSLEI